MRWDRQRVATVAAVFAVLVVTSFFIRWTVDHDGETLVLFDDGPTPSAVATLPVDDVESGETDPESGLAWVREDELPVEGQATLALIDQGGPFPYEQDGSTFGNREGLLPDRPRGYYAEYTVLTPGSADRGARRIVTGDGGEHYWTEDHYESFERIARRIS